MSECSKPECTEALIRLHEFIDEEIDTATSAQIQQHLDDCSSCLDSFAIERLVKALVSRSCREAAPAPLRERVLYSIRTVQIEISDREL